MSASPLKLPSSPLYILMRGSLLPALSSMTPYREKT